jgi:hypothetical protein
MVLLFSPVDLDKIRVYTVFENASPHNRFKHRVIENTIFATKPACIAFVAASQSKAGSRIQRR